MNITELVGHLKNVTQANELISVELPGVDYDLVELYMKEKVDLDSEIIFLDAETIPNDLIIELNGTKYENLFPFYLIQEMVEEYAADYPNLSSLEVAERIINYRINDA